MVTENVFYIHRDSEIASEQSQVKVVFTAHVLSAHVQFNKERQTNVTLARVKSYQLP